MTGKDNSGDYIHQPRRDRMYEQHVEDPYVKRGKWQEPTVCPDCNAVYHDGHWQWADIPEGAHQHRCPACSRIHDKVPAGILSLEGEFLSEHKDEILSLIHNEESKEKAQRPLERIMSIEEETDGVVIQYTGIHLTKSTGAAIHKAYQGDLNTDFNDRDAQIRVAWKR